MKTSVAQIRKIMTKWRARLRVPTHWKLSIRLNRTESDEEEEDQRDCAARISADPGYGTVDLIVNEWHIANRKELNKILAHECVHLVLWPLWCVVHGVLNGPLEAAGRDMLEAATEQITYALTKGK